MTPPSRRSESYKAGATLEDGTYVRSSRELQLIEPVTSLVPPPSPNRGGRPTSYTEEIAATVCNGLAQGNTLLQICAEDPSLPDHSTIRLWAQENRNGFFAQYARARDLGLDAMAEQLFSIADDGSKDYIERVGDSGQVFRIPDHEHMARSRLRIETRKWYLSKLAPKRYGEKVEIEMSKSSSDEMGVILAAVCTPAELADLNGKMRTYVERYRAQKAQSIEHLERNKSEALELETSEQSIGIDGLPATS